MTDDHLVASTTSSSHQLILSVADEIEALKKIHSNIRIIAATKSFVTFTYERTPSAKVKATFTFPDGYPHAASLIATLDWLVPGLQKKLERELAGVAKEQQQQAKAAAAAATQVQAAALHLKMFMDTNLFVPCWKELRKTVEMVQNSSTATVLALQETKGLVRLKLTTTSTKSNNTTNATYHCECKIKIHPDYPSTPTNEEWGTACKLMLIKSNFPKPLEHYIFSQQAQRLVRNLQDGMTTDQALRRSNPIQLPESSVELLESELPPESTTRIISSSSSDKKNNGWQTKEKARLESYDVDNDDGGDPQPSLLLLVTFLCDTMKTLPHASCPMCESNVLPNSPTALQALYDDDNNNKKTMAQKKRNKNQRPTPSSCGCWFHYQCLHKCLTEPPFGDACPSNNHKHKKIPVYHPELDNNMDRSTLERNWTQLQARQREMDDVAMMF